MHHTAQRLVNLACQTIRANGCATENERFIERLAVIANEGVCGNRARGAFNQNQGSVVFRQKCRSSQGINALRIRRAIRNANSRTLQKAIGHHLLSNRN